MKKFQRYCLTLFSFTALCVAAITVSTEPTPVEADSELIGYTKHCPVYYYGSWDGDQLFMTQNSETCGSDYVWTPEFPDITTGAADCGWPQDCLDPIFVDENGEALVLNLNDANNPVKGLVGLQPIPETEQLPVQTRIVRVGIQESYVAPRSNAPGDSDLESGKFKKTSDRVSFTGDADFVVKVTFGDKDVRYFRVLELKMASDNSADDQVIRFGKEIDPNLEANRLAKYEARVLKSSRNQTHVLQLMNGEDNRKILATTVSPVAGR